MMEVLKFKGDFKKLISMGYIFQKMHTSNHICYSKGVEHGDHIWIWKKGRDIEIMDLYENSSILMKYLININFTPPENSICVVNKKNKAVEEFEWDKHDAVLKAIQFEKEQERKIIGVEFEKMTEELYETYKQVLLCNKIIAILKELYDNDMIEFVKEGT